MDGNKTEIKRKEKGLFADGTAPGPGRPKGSVSVIGRIKQIYENDPEKFDEFVKRYIENKDNDRHQVEMIDGKPTQAIANADGEPFVVQVINYGDNDSTSVQT